MAIFSRLRQAGDLQLDTEGIYPFSAGLVTTIGLPNDVQDRSRGISPFVKEDLLAL
ncbi:MAG TPA: hypothetical protein VF906_07540 [Candidatus Bathyarchaeia archaeon]